MNPPAPPPCGALALPDGSVRWRVWAPRARRVELILIDGARRRAVAMIAEDHGYFHHEEPSIAEGQRYVYRLDGGPERPDPASRWQPDGVHAASAVLRPDQFHWTDQSRTGIERQDLVFYELHVGAFTREGTFDAIIPRLESLRDLGITAIQLMPVAQFPGTRNWGYDGVSLYAVQGSYGGPHGLQRLVDACHTRGLAVFLDAVYNHLGPEGNYLQDFGPYFTDRYRTPWGPAFNFDGAGCDAVRAFILDNVRWWIETFHVDGLRIDAVHAIFDMSPRHILRDIKQVADAAVARDGEPPGRRVHLIAESNLNDVRLLLPPEQGGYGLDAQWSDDFHHMVHVHLTSENQGYYLDFGRIEDWPKLLADTFVYTGDHSAYRGRRYGAPVGDLAGDRFVIAIQNHDQVGNRARGDRLSTLVEPAAQRLAAGLLLFAPHLPLVFMGEDYGERNPFLFFCSFGDPDLIENVRRGRRQEFAAFAWQGEVPDPQAESSFFSSKLTWSWPEGTHHAGLRRLYRDLLAARRTWPPLKDFVHRQARLLPDPKAGPILELTRSASSQTLWVFFNLTSLTQPRPCFTDTVSVPLFSSEAKQYGGGRTDLKLVEDLRPWECLAFAGI